VPEHPPPHGLASRLYTENNREITVCNIRSRWTG
jgi:hypothetical protein